MNEPEPVPLVDQKELDRFVTEFRAKRKAIETKYFVYVFIGLIVLLVSLTILIVDFRLFSGEESGSVFEILGWVSGLSLLASFFFLGKAILIKESYVDSIKKEVGARIEKSFFTKTAQADAKGFTYDEFVASGFFSEPEKYQDSDAYSASYSGINFQKAHFRLQHLSLINSPHDSMKNYSTYRIGTLYRFRFNKSFPFSLKVLFRNRRFGYVNDKTLTSIKTEYRAFNETFEASSNDAKGAFYLLTPQVQEKLIDLENLFYGAVSFSFSGDSFYVLLDDPDEKIKISFLREISADDIKKIFVLASLPKIVVDYLDLDSFKFQ